MSQSIGDRIRHIDSNLDCLSKTEDWDYIFLLHHDFAHEQHNFDSSYYFVADMSCDYFVLEDLLSYSKPV